MKRSSPPRAHHRETPFKSVAERRRRRLGRARARACPNKYSTPKSRFSFSHYQPGYVPRRAAGERLPRYNLSRERIHGDHRHAPRRHVRHEKMVRVLAALPALVHRVSLMPVALFADGFIKSPPATRAQSRLPSSTLQEEVQWPRNLPS